MVSEKVKLNINQENANNFASPTVILSSSNENKQNANSDPKASFNTPNMLLMGKSSSSVNNDEKAEFLQINVEVAKASKIDNDGNSDCGPRGARI